MGFRLGEVSGFKIRGTKLSGFSQVIDFGDPKRIAKLKASSLKTDKTPEQIKLDEELARYKLDSLENDVFEKQETK